MTSSSTPTVGSVSSDASARDVITVTVKGTSQLNEAHRAAFTKIVQDYAFRVFEVASKEEWLRRARGVRHREFSTKNFVDAERSVLDAGWVRLKTPRWHIVVEVFQPPLWAFAGWALSMTPNGWGWAVVTALTMVVAAVSLAIEKIHKWMLENK